MSLVNSVSAYGAVAKTFHWLIALLIFAAIPLGIVANDMPYDTSEALARKATLFSMHKTVGVTIFVVAVLRVLWAIVQPKPGLLNGDRPLEARAAETVHWILYGCLILVPLTGWIHHASTTGFAPIWWPFGQSLPFVPKSESLAAVTAGLHVTFERVLIVALLLHIAGALKHHFIDRDATLRRMLPGRTELPVDKTHFGLQPPLTALAVFLVAMGAGAALGVYHEPGPAAQVAELAEVETGWTVEQGTLGISVVQFGSQVDGGFADWTAAIDFSEEPGPEGKHGTVEVTIAIGSVDVGSVTAQALQPDYFDAEAHPTATFAADILAGDAPDTYVADGTLTLKGTEVPVSLPFTLRIEGDTATMTGETAVDRRDFGIGAQETNESNLAFSVPIKVSLTATRATE